jgi:hypothetical protein
LGHQEVLEVDGSVLADQDLAVEAAQGDLLDVEGEGRKGRIDAVEVEGVHFSRSLA